MNDTYLRLAREAGFDVEPCFKHMAPYVDGILVDDQVGKLIALVAEECALAVESNDVQSLSEAAAAIRAKFKGPT